MEQPGQNWWLFCLSNLWLATSAWPPPPICEAINLLSIQRLWATSFAFPSSQQPLDQSIWWNGFDWGASPERTSSTRPPSINQSGLPQEAMVPFGLNPRFINLLVLGNERMILTICGFLEGTGFIPSHSLLASASTHAASKPFKMGFHRCLPWVPIRQSLLNRKLAEICDDGLDFPGFLQLMQRGPLQIHPSKSCWYHFGVVLSPQPGLGEGGCKWELVLARGGCFFCGASLSLQHQRHPCLRSVFLGNVNNRSPKNNGSLKNVGAKSWPLRLLAWVHEPHFPSLLTLLTVEQVCFGR